MAKMLKKLGQLLDERKIAKLVGKTIHVPTNKHLVKQETEETTVNAWFAGQVAGYEKACLQYDFQTGKFLDEPRFFFNILLSDGMSYQLALEDSEIVELNDEEFTKLIAEHQAAVDVEKQTLNIITPDKPRIILPGE